MLMDIKNKHKNPIDLLSNQSRAQGYYANKHKNRRLLDVQTNLKIQDEFLVITT